MDLIKAGIGFSKTIKNVRRLKEIVAIFAHHGFRSFISRGVTSNIPDFVIPESEENISQELQKGGEKNWNQILGHRLRLCFEELGPVFIKFGQLMSSREDIFHKDFTDELKALTDDVTPVPFEEVKELIETSIGKSLNDIFEFVDKTPIGTASIGVVYKGRLISGEDIVIKVKRPNIEKKVYTDFEILKFLAVQLEKVSKEVKYLGLSRIVEDFAYGLQNELDFNIELRNCLRLKRNLEKHDSENIFYLPKVYEDLSSKNVLVMEFLKGISFNNTEKIIENIDDVVPKLEAGIKIFIKNFLYDGFFHADLHGGNFFYLENKKIGLIDFGLMGTLGKKGRQSFMAIIFAIVNWNYENLVFEFLDVAEYSKNPDIDEMIHDVKYALSPFIGLTVQQTNFSILLNEVLGAMKKHEVYLPREWYIVFRALITLDGVGKSIGQDFDLFAIFERDIESIIRDNFKNQDWREDVFWSLKDILSIGRVIPKHLKWFLKDWSQKKYRFEIKHSGHEKESKAICHAILFLGFCFLTGVFFSIGSLFLISFSKGQIESWKDIPSISYIFWGGGILFLLLCWKNLKIAKDNF